MSALRRGDRVEWETSQSPARGRIVRRLTKPLRIKGHRVAASPDHPEYLVESDTSGARAAHRPGALRKR